MRRREPSRARTNLTVRTEVRFAISDWTAKQLSYAFIQACVSTQRMLVMNKAIRRAEVMYAISELNRAGQSTGCRMISYKLVFLLNQR